MGEGSTYGVGGFAMIEARDNGESSRAGGADTEIWLVKGRTGGDKDIEAGAGGGKDVEAGGAGGDEGVEAAGTGVAEGCEEREVRLSVFVGARGIGTGEEVGEVDCDLRLSPEVARVIGGGARAVVANPLVTGIGIDSDSNFGISKRTGGEGEGGTGGGNGLSTT